MMKKELVTLKKTSENREHADQELVASVVKERDHYKMKWEAEKEKGRVFSLVLEEEKELKVRNKVQVEDELEARRVAKLKQTKELDWLIIHSLMGMNLHKTRCRFQVVQLQDFEPNDSRKH